LKSLIVLEKYAKKNNINILLMTPGQADDFIYSLQGSPNSIRLTVAGISAFYCVRANNAAQIQKVSL
jgi:hypothetical protein